MENGKTVDDIDKSIKENFSTEASGWNKDGSMNTELFALLLERRLRSMTKEQMDAVPEAEGNLKLIDGKHLIFVSGEWRDLEEMMNVTMNIQLSGGDE